MTYRSWSGPARTMALAIDAAVAAARAADAAAFADARAELRRLDREQLAEVLGTVLRDVLEQTHPDGLDSDDAEQALQSCIRGAAGWYPQLDTDALIRALTDALGVTDPETAPAVDPAVVVDHGVLLAADQLACAGRPVAPILDGALRELQRAQTVELP